MARLSATASHLTAFSHLLANDSIAGKLNMRELQIIALLADGGKAMTIGDIAGALTLSSSYLSRVVEKLVKLGFVKRAAQASDRRLVLIAVSTSGRALNERVRQQFASAAVVNA